MALNTLVHVFVPTNHMFAEAEYSQATTQRTRLPGVCQVVILRMTPVRHGERTGLGQEASEHLRCCLNAHHKQLRLTCGLLA